MLLLIRVDKDRSGQISAVELAEALSNGKVLVKCNACVFRVI